MLSNLTRRTIALTALATLTGLAAGTAKAEDPGTPASVTLINAFEVGADQLDQTITFWEKARDFLQTQPGYISTRLHQSLSPEARFQLVNVAQWESPEAFQAAIANMRRSNLGNDMKGTVFHAALYRVIRTDEEQK